MSITGRAYQGRKTKDLVKRLHAGDIAVIDHSDIDRVSAEALVACGVVAVINATRSISGRYPNVGPSLLAAAGIALIDNAGQAVFTELADGAQISVEGGRISCEGELIAEGSLLDGERIEAQLAEADREMDAVMEQFVRNTVEYLDRQSVALIYDPTVPEIRTQIRGRQVLVVVRGYDYLADLKMLTSYIRDMHPVLIAVDGGADALLEQGFTPQIILGDMDSVTDKALFCGAEIIPHAYEDGSCPSQARLDALGIVAEPWPLAATSEDLALLLAWEKKADLIVALGTHSNLIEYLDKGRSGMASSFLVRLKVGTRLVDAKGVSKLYRAAPPLWQIPVVVLAALLVVVTVIITSEPLRNTFLVLWLNIRAYLGL
jgi:uncharacterized membrane-anchored protein